MLNLTNLLTLTGINLNISTLGLKETIKISKSLASAQEKSR
jgi:hypothetical protein